jgi:hypothetical protein
LRAPHLSLQSFLVTGLLALAGLVGSAGCGDAIAACDKKCDCEKCPTSLHNACIATNESDQQSALQLGCTSELDDLHTCQVTTGVCKGTDFETKCDAQEAAWKACGDPKK